MWVQLQWLKPNLMSMEGLSTTSNFLAQSHRIVSYRTTAAMMVEVDASRSARARRGLDFVRGGSPEMVHFEHDRWFLGAKSEGKSIQRYHEGTYEYLR